MIRTEQEFQQQMRSDRAFRQCILAAHKTGTLAKALAQEGYELDLRLLDVRLPQVNTDLHAGSACTGSCECAIITRTRTTKQG
jgi:hypothetical protein